MTSTRTTPNPSRPIPSSAAHGVRVRDLRTVRRLLVVYFVLGALTLGFVALMRHHRSVVDTAVWTRSIIVVGTAMILMLMATVAAHGSRGAFLRLRVVSVVTTVAIACIVVLPGAFPAWLRCEQAVCGVVMLGVAALANGPRLRGLFATSR